MTGRHMLAIAREALPDALERATPNLLGTLRSFGGFTRETVAKRLGVSLGRLDEIESVPNDQLARNYELVWGFFGALGLKSGFHPARPDDEPLRPHQIWLFVQVGLLRETTPGVFGLTERARGVLGEHVDCEPVRPRLALVPDATGEVAP